MRRKRIIRYFIVALVSIVIVVSIRACIDIREDLDAIFRCPTWFYPHISSKHIVHDVSSEAVQITVYIHVTDHLMQDVYVPIVEAYASTGSVFSHERYEGRYTRAGLGALDTTRHAITFNLPRGGTWNLNVTYAFASRDSDYQDCKHTDTYEVNTEF